MSGDTYCMYHYFQYLMSDSIALYTVCSSMFQYFTHPTIILTFAVIEMLHLNLKLTHLVRECLVLLTTVFKLLLRAIIIIIIIIIIMMMMMMIIKIK